MCFTGLTSGKGIGRSKLLPLPALFAGGWSCHMSEQNENSLSNLDLEAAASIPLARHKQGRKAMTERHDDHHHYRL
jgi:hypothetical protein